MGLLRPCARTSLMAPFAARTPRVATPRATSAGWRTSVEKNGPGSRTGLRWAGNLITRLRLRSWLAARVRERAIDLVEVPDYPGFLPFAVPGCATVVRLHQSSTVSHRLAGLKMSAGVRFYEKRTLAANS